MIPNLNPSNDPLDLPNFSSSRLEIPPTRGGKLVRSHEFLSFPTVPSPQSVERSGVPST